MPKSRNHETRGARSIAVRFQMRASADEVAARLLESVRRTDLSLLKVFGDGECVYPFTGRDPARTASEWRAELSWNHPAIKPGWFLELFLARAELFLELPGGMRLEAEANRTAQREEVEW